MKLGVVSSREDREKLGIFPCRDRDIQMPSKVLDVEAQRSRDVNGMVFWGGCVVKVGRGADDEERNMEQENEEEQGMRGKESRDTKTVRWVAGKRALGDMRRSTAWRRPRTCLRHNNPPLGAHCSGWTPGLTWKQEAMINLDTQMARDSINGAAGCGMTDPESHHVRVRVRFWSWNRGG